jgi:hypothetical protein
MDILKTLFDLLSRCANTLGTLLPLLLLGMLATEQRRVRPAEFAKELGISLRKLRELFTLGAPITKIQGLVFVNPETFYRWLDGFERKGRPGIKGRRGVSDSKATVAKSPAQTRSKKEFAAAE